MSGLSLQEINRLDGIALKIRRHVARTISESDVDHPGGSLSAADILTILYFHVMYLNPQNPQDEERDRFRRNGKDVTLIGSGVMKSQCIEEVGLLIDTGAKARVLHVPCLKPIDKEVIRQAAKETGVNACVENHNINSSISSAVMEILDEHVSVPMVRVGIQDC
jgi:transketolase